MTVFKTSITQKSDIIDGHFYVVFQISGPLFFIIYLQER